VTAKTDVEASSAATPRPGAPRRGGSGRRASRSPFALILYLSLLVVAWVFANPPGYLHDEPAHYTKALGVGHFDWQGKPGKYPIGPGFGPLQLEWINQAARTYEMPPDMAGDKFACSVFHPKRSAVCLDQLPTPTTKVARLTYVGSYEPFLYLPPGLAMRLAHTATAALRVGRVVSAAIALALLVLAVLVLHVPGEPGVPALGLLAATTPMVVFLVSGLSPAGPEIAAQLCFVAAFVRLTRRLPVTPLVWTAAAAAGAVLAMSRSLGPFFVAYDIVLFALVVGPSGLRGAVRTGGRAAKAAGAVVVAGVVADAWWGVTVQAHPGHKLADVLGQVPRAIADVPEVLRQGIGSFGWADVNMPRFAYLAWAFLVVALVGLALVLGTRRERFAVAAVVAAAFAGTVVIDAAVIRQTHFPMYGRYALPLWVVVPLVAGEVVFRNRRSLPAALQWRGLVAATVIVASIQVIGFYWTAHQYAVGGYGPVLFLGRSKWSPPVHWGTWVALVAAAAIGLVSYGVASARMVRDG
jgi:hypothetical protein